MAQAQQKATKIQTVIMLVDASHVSTPVRDAVKLTVQMDRFFAPSFDFGFLNSSEQIGLDFIRMSFGHIKVRRGELTLWTSLVFAPARLVV